MTEKNMTKQSYEESINEINTLLSQIEDGEISIDELGEIVERASSLIQSCRTQLNSTELQVQKALEGLQN